MTEIPVLTTRRLVLRGPEMADFDAYAAFWSSPGNTRHIGGPQDRSASWRRFAADAGHWQLRGFGWWTITEAGAPVGNAGVHHPPYQADPEIGWVLYAGARGRGLATEAATAILGWVAQALRPDRLVSYIDTANAASSRLAERLGARRDPGRAAHDPDCYIYLHDLRRVAP